jgi:hypothetical protein
MVFPTIERGDRVYHMQFGYGMGFVVNVDKWDEIAHVEWPWGFESWEYFGDLMLIN